MNPVGRRIGSTTSDDSSEDESALLIPERRVVRFASTSSERFAEEYSFVLQQVVEEGSGRVLVQFHSGDLAAVQKGARRVDRLGGGGIRKREIFAGFAASVCVGAAGGIGLSAVLVPMKTFQFIMYTKWLLAGAVTSTTALYKMRMQRSRFESFVLHMCNGQIEAKENPKVQELVSPGGSRRVRYAKTFTTPIESYSVFVMDSLEEGALEFHNKRVAKEISSIHQCCEHGISPHIEKILVLDKNKIYEASLPFKVPSEVLQNIIRDYEHFIVGYVSEPFHPLINQMAYAIDQSSFKDQNPLDLIDKRVELLEYIITGLEGYHQKFFSSGFKDVLGREVLENFVVCFSEEEVPYKIVGIEGLISKDEQVSNAWEEISLEDQGKWDKGSFFGEESSAEVKHEFMHFLKIQAAKELINHNRSIKQMIIDLVKIAEKVPEPDFKPALQRTLTFYEQLSEEHSFVGSLPERTDEWGGASFTISQIIEGLKQGMGSKYPVCKGFVQRYVPQLKDQVMKYLKYLLTEEPLLQTMECYIRAERKKYNSFFERTVIPFNPFSDRLQQVSLQKLFGLPNHDIGLGLRISDESLSDGPLSQNSLEEFPGLVIGKGTSKIILASPYNPSLCTVISKFEYRQSVISQYTKYKQRGMPDNEFKGWSLLPKFAEEFCFHYRLLKSHPDFVVKVYSFIFSSVPRSVVESREKNIVFRAIFNDSLKEVLEDPTMRDESNYLFTSEALKKLDSQGIMKLDESKLYLPLGVELERFDGDLGSLLISSKLSYPLLTQIKKEFKRLLDIIVELPVWERPKDLGEGNFLYKIESFDLDEASLAAASMEQSAERLKLALTDVQPACSQGEEKIPSIELAAIDFHPGLTFAWKLFGKESYNISLMSTLKAQILTCFGGDKPPEKKELNELSELLINNLDAQQVHIDPKRGIYIQQNDQIEELYWDGQFKGFKISPGQESNYTINRLLELINSDHLDQFLLKRQTEVTP